MRVSETYSRYALWLILFIISQGAQGNSGKEKKEQVLTLGSRVSIQYITDIRNKKSERKKPRVTKENYFGKIIEINPKDSVLKIKKWLSNNVIELDIRSIYALKVYRYSHSLALAGIAMVPHLYFLRTSTNPLLGLPLESWALITSLLIVDQKIIHPYRIVHPDFAKKKNAWSLQVTQNNLHLQKQ